VFVSSSSTEDWAPDEDVPGSDMHELVHTDGVWAGMTRVVHVNGPIPFTADQREVAFVLEGSARIEFAGGGEITVKPGDFFSIPAGAETTWHITAPFKETWFFAE
jgi:uncharacterized cupin superfamily protein